MPRYGSIFKPTSGVERCVSNVPYGAAPVLIRAGAGLDLHLSVTASHLGIYRRQHQPDLADEIRIDARRRVDARLITSIVHALTVHRCIDVTCANPRKSRQITAGGADASTAQNADEVENI